MYKRRCSQRKKLAERKISTMTDLNDDPSKNPINASKTGKKPAIRIAYKITFDTDPKLAP